MSTSAAPSSHERESHTRGAGEQAPPALRSFKDYYVGTILRPRRTFDALMADDRRLRFGLLALALNAALYELVYIFLTIGHGAPSSFKPFLNVTREHYYQYNRFWLIPSMVGACVLAAGVAQLLSRLFGGEGSFEDTLSAFGFATAIACLASLLHDLPDSFLGAIGVIDLRRYEVLLNTFTVWRVILLTLYGISILWFMVLYPKGVGAAQRLKTGPAVFVGLAAYFVYQSVFVIFNR